MGARLATVALAVALAILRSCDATVELVLAIHRHGARCQFVVFHMHACAAGIRVRLRHTQANKLSVPCRTVLVKNATSLAEGGASLTAQGADQLRTVGKVRIWKFKRKSGTSGHVRLITQGVI